MYIIGLIIFVCLSLLFIEYVFPKIGLMDKPEKYGYDRKPIPYSAGVLFYLVFVGTVFLYDHFVMEMLDFKMIMLIVAATVLMVVSFLDDRFDLSPYFRLVVQGLIVAGIVWSGTTIYGVNVPFYGWMEFGLIGGGIVTWIWIVMVINVINWLDGRPILASGVSGVSFLVLFALASIPSFHTLPQEHLTVLSLGLAVSCLIYTFWNVPKHKMLMGDSGSMFLGLMIGVLSVYAGGKMATAALVLALPMFDVVWIILRRLSQGVSPFRGDFKHLHHRLGRVGLSDNKLTLFYSVFSLLLGALSLLLLSSDSKGLLTIIMAVLLVGGAFLIVKLETS